MTIVRLRVYGWQSTRREATGWHKQTREIVAAHSLAEVARIVGVKSPASLFNLSETTNQIELKVAGSKPGVIFWKSSAPYNENYVESAEVSA